MAYNAKITMFDVDIASTENYLNVPSLHNVALPPAYAAGARVGVCHREALIYQHALYYIILYHKLPCLCFDPSSPSL